MNRFTSMMDGFSVTMLTSCEYLMEHTPSLQLSTSPGHMDMLKGRVCVRVNMWGYTERGTLTEILYVLCVRGQSLQVSSSLGQMDMLVWVCVCVYIHRDTEIYFVFAYILAHHCISPPRQATPILCGCARASVCKYVCMHVCACMCTNETTQSL